MDTTSEVRPRNSLFDSPLPRTPIEWVARSYESSEQWKRQAREVFLSVNGESNVARNRVAALVRDYFIGLPAEPEAVRRWKKGCDEIETIIMQPPKVSASNAAYFDWLHIADFLLLACASQNDDLPENQTRDSEYRAVLESFRIRNIVFHVRKVLTSALGVTDQEVLSLLEPVHPSIALAHVKEARRLERSGFPDNQPFELAPPSHVPLFVSIYFPRN